MVAPSGRLISGMVLPLRAFDGHANVRSNARPRARGGTMATAATLDAPLTLDNLDITDTDLYVQRGYPWKEWDLLRREAPVYWYERPGFEPFWAITKYWDIQAISKKPELFSNRQ